MSLRGRFISLLIGPIATLILGLLSGPLISHLFTPAQFGRYAVLLAIVGIGVVTVTLRFDQLITNSEDKYSNFWIVLASSVCGALCLSILSLLICQLSEALFIFSATLTVAVFNAFYYLLVISDKGLRASCGKSIQAGSILGSQALLGLQGLGLGGLLVGEALGRTISLLIVFQKIAPRSVKNLTNSFNSQWGHARWMLLSGLVGALALQALPLGLTASVGAASAGAFLLVYRMVVIPNSLISKVASDVLFVELTRTAKTGKDIEKPVAVAFQKLLLASVCIYGCLFVFGSLVFRVILAESWHSILYIIPWLSVFVGAWSIAAPLSAVFICLKKTHISLFLSILDILIKVASLGSGYLFNDIFIVVSSLCVGGALVLFLSIRLALRLAGVDIYKSLIAVYPTLLFSIIALTFSAISIDIGLIWLAVCLGAILMMVVGREILYG